MIMRYLPIVCIFVIFLIPIPSYAETIQGKSYTESEIPAKKKDCNLCHVSHMMKGTSLLKKPISELCTECHPNSKAPSEHIVDVVPSMSVVGLPLTKGRLTCVTCHEPHKNSYGVMLRVSPENLCQLCHKK